MVNRWQMKHSVYKNADQQIIPLAARRDRWKPENNAKHPKTGKESWTLKYVIIHSWNVVIHRTKYFCKYHSAAGSREGKLSLCSIFEAVSLPCKLPLWAAADPRNAGIRVMPESEAKPLPWVLRQHKARPLQSTEPLHTLQFS